MHACRKAVLGLSREDWCAVLCAVELGRDQLSDANKRLLERVETVIKRALLQAP